MKNAVTYALVASLSLSTYSLLKPKPPTYQQGYLDGAIFGHSSLESLLYDKHKYTDFQIDSIYTANYRKAKLERNR